MRFVHDSSGADRAQLSRILASTAFEQADRPRNFLSFVVTASLDGRAGDIKEFVIAVGVLGRTTLNQGLDMASDYTAYRPTALMRGSDLKDDNLPAPETDERYSDAQLFALTKFLYSLTPPANPNHSTALSQRGEKVFAREGCNRFHTAPLYTSNKLTPTRGFSVTEQHLRSYDIEPTLVGTDTDLTMRTWRGTGFYKTPPLRGVWYRGPFEHSGSVATLEDWFDPRRLRNDYVPQSFGSSPSRNPSSLLADSAIAASWLENAFVFSVRLRIANHSIQMRAGKGCFTVAEGTVVPNHSCVVEIRITNAWDHCERARLAGAQILSEPSDHVYGERRYNAEDFYGHRWDLTESIADVAPESWGGTLVAR